MTQEEIIKAIEALTGVIKANTYIDNNGSWPVAPNSMNTVKDCNEKIIELIKLFADYE